jgi:hypothetical protein
MPVLHVQREKISEREAQLAAMTERHLAPLLATLSVHASLVGLAPRGRACTQEDLTNMPRASSGLLARAAPVRRAGADITITSFLRRKG